MTTTGGHPPQPGGPGPDREPSDPAGRGPEPDGTAAGDPTPGAADTGDAAPAGAAPDGAGTVRGDASTGDASRGDAACAAAGGAPAQDDPTGAADGTAVPPAPAQPADPAAAPPAASPWARPGIPGTGQPHPDPSGTGPPPTGPPQTGPHVPGPGRPGWPSPGWQAGSWQAGPPPQPGPWQPGPWPAGPPPQQWTGHGPPLPPPGRRRSPLIPLLVVGALMLAGLGIGTALLLGAARQGQTSALVPIRGAALTYGVPADWTTGGEPFGAAIGLEFTGVARGAAYECGGSPYVRGIVGSVLLPGSTPPQFAAVEAARLVAGQYYSAQDGAPPQVSVGPPRTVDVAGVEGTLVEAQARTARDDGCLATTGVVLALAVAVTGPGGQPGTALLLVNGDAEGGPDDPPSPDRATLDAIIASARPAGI